MVASPNFCALRKLKIILTFFEENKMQYTIGPEGVEMVNAKDEVVFDMRCEDDLPVVEFINPKTNHRFSVRPQSNGDFVLEWKENNSVKMKISQKGVEIFGEEYTGLSIHDLKSGYFHRFPASSDGLTPTESGDVR
jgi:hypothetical protein